LLAAKTELKTIASKIIQHPAVTIERIKLRRRIIELSVQTDGRGRHSLLAKRRPLIVRSVAWGLGTPRDCDDDTIVTARGNKIRSKGRSSGPTLI
jgi:hypothetical protein